MGLVFDLLFEFVFALFGVLAGVLYPPKSPAWARWQRGALALGVVSILAFGVAAAFAWHTDGSAVVWPAAILGLISLIGYAIVGNVCRKYHEGK